MDAGTFISQQLKGSAAVQAVCAGRVYAVRIPQNTPMPAVCFTLVSNIADQYILNQRSDDKVRVQVSVFADDYATVATVSAACRVALDGLRVGNIGVALELEADHFEDGADRYHRSQDYHLNLPNPLAPGAGIAPTTATLTALSATPTAPLPAPAQTLTALSAVPA